MLEFFHGGPSDFTAVFENHGIALHLNGCMNVYQHFEGKQCHSQMRRGSISISPAGAPKTFQHKAGGDFLVVHISPLLLSRIAKEAKCQTSGEVVILNMFCTRDVLLERLALQLWDEYQTNDVASGISAESLANQLGVHLLRRYSSLGAAPKTGATTLSAKALRRAMDYIEANLGKDLTVEEVARAISLGRWHFAHAFKNTIGVAPHQYVVERRIELAKLLLRETDLPIANIAARAGFSTQSHFCVTFQRLTGTTAGTFRKKK